MKHILILIFSTVLVTIVVNGQINSNTVDMETEFLQEYLDIINKKQLQPHNLPTYTGVKQRMDSVIHQVYSNHQWTNKTKTYHEYNEFENETIRLSYNWDNDIYQWVAKNKIVKNYDVKGNLTFYYEQEWNPSIKSWQPYVLKEFAYKQNNKLVSKTIYRSWSHLDSKWKNGYRYAYYYSEDNLMEKIISEIDIATGQWNLKSVDKYSYNLTNDIITKQYLEWSDADQKFVGKYLDENNYLNGNLYRTVRHLWTNQWLPVIQISCDYGIDGKLDQMNLLAWSNITKTWNLRRKNMVDYNHKGIMTESQTYMLVAGEWVGTSRFLKEYDMAGNFNALIVYDWDQLTQNWKLERKTTSLFDFSVSANKIITPFPENYDYRHKITVDSSLIWNSLFASWSATERKHYNYSSEVLITDHDEINLLFVNNGMLYPNPVKEIANFDYNFTANSNKIFIYQTDGKLIYSTTIEQHKVNLSHLAGGIYIYRIVDGESQITGKLIKE